MLALAGCASRSSSTVTTTATVWIVDDEILFVDEDDSPYYPTLPEGEICDIDGNAIGENELESGNVVRVTGDGLMLESYPAQYPGITKVEVIEEGSPEDVQVYEDELLDSFTVSVDPSEPPAGGVDWWDGEAVSSASLLCVGYSWSTDEESGEMIIADGTDALDAVVSGMPELELGEPTAVTASFTSDVTGALVTRYSESDLLLDDEEPEGYPVDLTLEEDGAVTFEAEAGYRYVLDVSFEDGEGIYVFTVMGIG